MTTLSLDAPQAVTARALAPVRTWLVIVATLIVAMVLVGGATRLTGSGLSITEWAPVTGAVPPLSAAAWTTEFEKYRATPQYALENRGMSLSDFKTIYLWEWVHRFLGRLIGIIYVVPLAAFARQGKVRGRLLAILLAIGAFGGLQGAVGWIMVASGLEPGMVAVAPIKLTAHLVLACALLAAVVAVATSLGRARAKNAPPGFRRLPAALVGLVLLQIGLGALVAGHHAGLIYNTWPLMEGAFVPPADVLAPLTPWWTNVFDTIATVQFDHRMGAYGLLALALWHAVDAQRRAPGSRLARRASGLAFLVLAQAGLGIVTLVLVAPPWAALLHQALAIAVLIAAVAHWRLIGLDSVPAISQADVSAGALAHR